MRILIILITSLILITGCTKTPEKPKKPDEEEVTEVDGIKVGEYMEYLENCAVTGEGFNVDNKSVFNEFVKELAESKEIKFIRNSDGKMLLTRTGKLSLEYPANTSGYYNANFDIISGEDENSTMEDDGENYYTDNTYSKVIESCDFYISAKIEETFDKGEYRTTNIYFRAYSEDVVSIRYTSAYYHDRTRIEDELYLDVRGVYNPSDETLTLEYKDFYDDDAEYSKYDIEKDNFGVMDILKEYKDIYNYELDYIFK